MKKYGKFVIGGIRQKVFNLVLYSMLLVMIVYSVVILQQMTDLNELVTETNEQQKESILQISQTTMGAVVDANLVSSTQLQAELADNLFGDTAGVVESIAYYTERVFAAPEDYTAKDIPLPDRKNDGVSSVQLLTEDGVDPADPVLAQKLGLLGNLSDMMMALYGNAKVDSVYVALPDGVMLLVDDHSGSKFDENGKIVTIPIRERVWYTGAIETGGLYFTDVTNDLFTGEISIMCSMPVYHNGKLIAVVGADLFLNDMADAAKNMSGNGSIVVIVNQNGHLIYSPQTEGAFKLTPEVAAMDLREVQNPEVASLVRDALGENTGLQIIDAGDEQYYAVGAPIANVGWAILSIVPKSLVDSPTLAMETQYDGILNGARDVYDKNVSNAKLIIAVLLIIASVLGSGASLILSKRMVRPLEAITNRVGALGGEDLQFCMEDTYRTGDEIEVLAESFAALSAKTLQYVDQVKRATAEKERIGAELNMATDIQTSQLPKLFPAFPQRPEFDIYASMTPAKEVGGDFYDFFLIDDDHIGLVMADVSGKGVPAALFMMVSRVLIKSHLQNGESPAEALANVNDQLCEGNEAGLFVTVWAAVIQISSGKGVSANAGHEHPALRRAGQQYELVTYKHSPAVALMEGMAFREQSFELHPGDSLFVYTDGVAEATNADKKLFGSERMLEALNCDPDAAPKDVLTHVSEGVDAFVAGADQFDDLTMLCFKYNGSEETGQKKA